MVKQSDFKMSKDSSFYVRQTRNFKSFPVLVKVKESGLDFNLFGSGFHLLCHENSVSILGSEITSLPLVKCKITFTDDIYLIVYNSYKILLDAKVFSISFFNLDILVAVFNDRHLFNIEQGTGKDQVEDQEKEMWNGQEDSQPNGHRSIGLDLKFVNSLHVYGIPEHATDYNLKSTKSFNATHTETLSEPYRLFNADVFEYILDSPMALYGSVPFLLSHNARNSFGVLWFNAAEQWIDIARSVY